MKGACARGPCAPGSFDFDGALTFGCEAHCQGLSCTDGNGVAVVVTAPPLPESGAVFQALASGSSYGAQVQTDSMHTNIGILGEPTPPGAGQSVVLSNSTHRNIGGFSAAQGAVP